MRDLETRKQDSARGKDEPKGSLAVVVLAALGMATGVIVLGMAAAVVLFVGLTWNAGSAERVRELLPSFGTPSSEEVVEAFREAGLEVGGTYSAEEGEERYRREMGFPSPVPKTYKEGTRFLIPPLGPDSGGRVFTFESEEDLEAVRNYYEGLGRASGWLHSWVYVEGKVLVQINGDLPEERARQYEAVFCGRCKELTQTRTVNAAPEGSLFYCQKVGD